MKKYLFALFPAMLTACTPPSQQSSVPLDLQTVQAYQQRIASAATNTQAEHWELHKNETTPKTVIIHHRPHRPHPTFHYGHIY